MPRTLPEIVEYNSMGGLCNVNAHSITVHSRSLELSNRVSSSTTKLSWSKMADSPDGYHIIEGFLTKRELEDLEQKTFTAE